MKTTRALVVALLLAPLPALRAAAAPVPVTQREDSCVIMEVSQAKADGNKLVWNIDLKQPGNYVVQLVVEIDKGKGEPSGTVEIDGATLSAKLTKVYRIEEGIVSEFDQPVVFKQAGTHTLKLQSGTGEGVIPAPSVERLDAIGNWLRVNGEAIYGCGPLPFGAELGRFSKTEKDKQGKPKFLPTAEWRATSKPGKVYIHLFQWPSGKLDIPAVNGKIARAYLLADPVRKGINVTQTDTGVSTTLPGNAPDGVASVLCFDLAS